MKYDYIYDSSKSVYEKSFEIDSENKKSLTVFFEKEGIVLTADTFGNAVFEKEDGEKIKEDKAQSDRLFSSIYCSVKSGEICVRFPVTETVDHYPNCDGEYDRYSVKIVDNIIITCPVG
ncbi:MAG: hypothetical protein IJO20_06455 [Ruminococcus sp.]|nr:hypothetical protein [Ruminococcus sp.]